MKNIKKLTNAINSRLLTCIFVITVGTSLMTGVALAQVTDTVDVTATVTAGVSTLNITETSVGFGAVTPDVNGSRFESGNVTGDYFAANGPWELRVYTTNAGNALGLIGQTNPNNTILLKVDPHADNDVTNDNDWSLTPEFFIVGDSSSSLFTSVVSSANGDPANNANLIFNFGIDASGAAAEPYSTTVTVDLAIL